MFEILNKFVLILKRSPFYLLCDLKNAQQIVNYLHALAQEHPHLVTLETLGVSHERRPLAYVRIGYPPSGSDAAAVDNNAALPQPPPPPTKSALFLDAGIHAREWIAPAVALKFVDKV